MSGCSPPSCPDSGVARLDHAIPLLAVGGPAQDLAREGRDLEAELAAAVAAGGVLLLGIAVRQWLRVGLAQAVEHRIGIGIVDGLADLAVHHALEVLLLRARGARREQQQDYRAGCSQEHPR